MIRDNDMGSATVGLLAALDVKPILVTALAGLRRHLGPDTSLEVQERKFESLTPLRDGGEPAPPPLQITVRTVDFSDSGNLIGMIQDRLPGAARAPGTILWWDSGHIALRTPS